MTGKRAFSLAIFLGALTVMGCGSSATSSNQPTSISLHAYEGSANNYERWVGQKDVYVLRGRVTEREVFQEKDDPYRPSEDSFDYGDMPQEEKDAWAREHGAAPQAGWTVEVVSKTSGPQINRVEQVIHVRRPLSDAEWDAYRTTGEFPARFAELEPEKTFDFVLHDDKFRRRGPNADKWALFTLTGWSASAE